VRAQRRAAGAARPGPRRRPRAGQWPPPLLAGEFGIEAPDPVLRSLSQRLAAGTSMRTALVLARADAMRIARGERRAHLDRRDACQGGRGGLRDRPAVVSGVRTALGAVLAAAAAVHTLLAGDGDAEAAIEYYAAYQRHAVERHAATAATIYSEHRAHADAPFWRSRSGGALTDLLGLPVRLADSAALRDTPCVVEDRVHRRRALTHPALDRPIAFLGGAELASLLDLLPEAPSLAHAIERWDAVLPPGRARAIAEWLQARDLFAERNPEYPSSRRARSASLLTASGGPCQARRPFAGRLKRAPFLRLNQRGVGPRARPRG
jgi:hypothetical protein